MINICLFLDARNSLEIFKLTKGLKLSYYNSEADELDLPTLDAYDFGPSYGHENTLLSPSPLVKPPISSPPEIAPSPSPSPSPYWASWISAPSANQPAPTHNDQVGPHYGPTQPIYQQPSLRPAGAPMHNWGPDYAVWCVARPTVPEPVLQRSMDYACGTGADCRSIRPNGPCFVPNTLVAHASYAFNSYWQRTKILGGTCDFSGTAMLITVDPSFSTCHFVYN